MDITDTLAPNSDQLDAVDLLGGPRTFTIERVSKGDAEQPVQVHLAEFPRPWRPGKSMRRVLAACWGTDSSQWTGRRVRLYCDPNVVFGKEKVGGTRISHLSHLDGPRAIPLLVSRGKSSTYSVQPLAEDAPTPARDWRAEADAIDDPVALRALYREAPAGVARDYIASRAQSLTATEAEQEPPISREAQPAVEEVSAPLVMGEGVADAEGGEAAMTPRAAASPPAQRKAVQAAVMQFERLGITDRAERLMWTGLIVGREIASTNDLTLAELRDVVGRLGRLKDRTALEALGAALEAEREGQSNE